jgi:hypothetical protein
VATWDGSPDPAVDVPLGGFFGSNLAPQRVRGLPAGIQGDRLYCYFPMPYRQGAHVRLVNSGPVGADELHYRVRYTPRTDADLLGLGRFHAKFNSEKPTTFGRDYTILEETGTGHLVGVIQTMQSQDTSRWYLEGDERIYVDGSGTPAIYGTGTEDFYNGGWYFNRGPFTLPMHGNPAHEVVNGRDTTDCYRFFLSDLIPFTSSIRVGIEHGAINEVLNDIWSVALYYKLPEPTAILTDELDVGSVSSENAHGYLMTGQTWTGSSSYTYEGDEDDVIIQDNGRRSGTAGESSFIVTIDPDAEGVLLRRRMDYGIPRQQAEVYVDGVLAGTWYEAGSNNHSRFRDSEFMIPPALTSGKSPITVRIRNASPNFDWSEYRYWVYSLLPIIPRPRADFDRDGDVDQADFGHLQACLGGPLDVPVPACATADLNRDGAVDQQDVLVFLGCVSGPNIPADPACAE